MIQLPGGESLAPTQHDSLDRRQEGGLSVSLGLPPAGQESLDVGSPWLLCLQRAFVEFQEEHR